MRHGPRGRHPLTWRLLIRADRIRRRLWPGLVGLIWLGCAHPHATPGLSAARVAATGLPEDAIRVVTVEGKQWQCYFRTLPDTTHILLYPPINHPAWVACNRAYEAWLKSL